MDFFEALEIMLKDFEKHLGWKHPNHNGSGLQIVNIVQEFERNRASAHNSDYAKFLDALKKQVEWNGWEASYLVDILKKALRIIAER